MTRIILFRFSKRRFCKMSSWKNPNPIPLHRSQPRCRPMLGFIRHLPGFPASEVISPPFNSLVRCQMGFFRGFLVLIPSRILVLTPFHLINPQWVIHRLRSIREYRRLKGRFLTIPETRFRPEKVRKSLEAHQTQLDPLIIRNILRTTERQEILFLTSKQNRKLKESWNTSLNLIARF